ncbi:uncharacterized protein C20orf173 homolog [Psammomys obesus]|uniref:uncharacterized protein C20orf173 homolog n=1 Tax=Psammomys obesus TaxID=48139 RepID=UPI0024535BBD|nr:uncharacterized protein C20orf173 homolog [Psammomys obesus]
MKPCWVLWELVLCLVAPYLDLTHESAPQQEWTYVVPQHCNWLCFKFEEHGCPSRTPNCSTCRHAVGGWNWIEACYEKTMGYLRRTNALWWLGINLVGELGKVWKKTSEVISRPLLHHFDFHCVPCAILGNSGLSNTNRFYMAISSEAELRNQTTGPFTCPRNESHQGYWRQQWLLQLSDLVPGGTRSPSLGFGSEQQRKWSYYQQNGNQTKGPRNTCAHGLEKQI